MNRGTRLALSALVLATGATDSSAADLEESLIQRIERAQLVGAGEELEDCRQRLVDRLDAEPQNIKLRYTVAYVDWRMVHLPSAENRDELLARAQEALEANVKEKPDDVESLALLAGVLGERIGERPMRGIVLGRRADAYLERAAEAEPDNPRVVLQQGISALHTPSMFGGSIKKAEERLRRARALFAQQPEEAPWPNWGRIDAYGWLGETLVRQQRYDEAQKIYEQALTLEPEAALIKHYLLPKLDSARRK